MKRMRQGYSLVELLVVFALTGVTISTAAVTMHSVHRTELRVHDEMRERRVLEQLVLRLRQDTHAAQAAVLKDPKNLSLTLATETSIEYAFSETGINRVVQHPTDLPHRESFLMKSFAPRSWFIDETSATACVALRFSTRDTDRRRGGDETADFVIVTAVGVSK
jgi:hypothetical protein